MVTELLYPRDAELRSFDAVVLSLVEGGVVLDRTAFDVTGGGQPHDTGTITSEGGMATVVDVREVDGEVVHLLEGDPPNEGPPSTARSTGIAATRPCARTPRCTCCAA